MLRKTSSEDYADFKVLDISRKRATSHGSHGSKTQDIQNNLDCILNKPFPLKRKIEGPEVFDAVYY